MSQLAGEPLPMLSMDGHVYYPDGLVERLPLVGRALVEPVVPRQVAERLAQALEAVKDCAGGADCSCGSYAVAHQALHQFRAVFPKAEEA